MRNTSKIFFLILIILVVAVSGYKFKQFYLDKDYTLLVNLECNPEVESCFSMNCSPEDDPECDLTPYKKLETYAGTAPECLLERTCLDFACSAGDENCSITQCSDESLEEWEMCIEPEVVEVADEALNESDE